MSEKFLEKHKLYGLVRKDNISQSMNTLRKKVKIHT